MEGTVAVCKYHLRAAFGRNWLTRLQALIAAPVLKHLGAQMDSRKYNGATLAGLNGIVIKSHGSADAFAFQHAIDTAIVEVRNQLPQQIGKLLEREAG
jgi:glycerol-3-phosphate acyltransferase PlsX